MSGRCDTFSIVNRVRHRDGRWIWVEAQCRALKDPQTGAATGVVGALRDVSARKAIEEELEGVNLRLKALAHQDGLTGLSNRRVFDEALAESHRRARIENASLAVVMIDVDRFKAFNDLYGHPAGDACLRRVADAISAAVRRQNDLATRYGGEEFALVLSDTDEAGALAVASRIQQAVERLQIEHAGSERNVLTISAGVAATDHPTSSIAADELVRLADRALYLAKRRGRNAVMSASALPPADAENTHEAA